MAEYQLGSFEGIRKKKKKEGFWPTTGSYVLGALEMLERPAQALKVGVKEAFDDDEEGFFEGVRQGWMGEDEVRAQDLLSEEFREEHPVLSGAFGFAGDVLTDPLTYTGAGLARAGIKGTGALAKALPGAAAVGRGTRAVMETAPVKSIARAFNVPVGRERQALELGKEAMDIKLSHTRGIEQIVDDYQSLVDDIVAKRGYDKELVDRAFVDIIEDFGAGAKGNRNIPQIKEAIAKATTKADRDRGNAYLKILGEDGLQGAVKAMKQHETFLKRERAIGGRTGEYGQQAVILGPSAATFRGYMRHVATPQARKAGGPEAPQMFKQHSVEEGYEKQRKLDQETIREANARLKAEKGFDVFHTDPGIIMGVRAAEHASAMSGNWFKRQVSDLKLGSTSSEIRDKGGVELSNYLDDLEASDLARIADIDDPLLAGKIVELDLPAQTKGYKSPYVKISGFKDENGRQLYFERELAKTIKDRYEMLQGKGMTNEFLKFWDDIQTGWKKWSLGIRPAYHTRNAVGNVLNAYTIAGVSNPAVYGAAAKLQWKARRGTLSSTDEVHGTGMTEREVWDAMNDNGVNAPHQYGLDVQRTTEQEMEALAGYKPGIGQRARTLGTESGITGKLVKGGFAVGGTIEGNARIAVFLDKLRKAKNPNSSMKFYDSTTGGKVMVGADGIKGKSVTGRNNFSDWDRVKSASQEVKKALFDYTDLSRVERDYFKRLIPFYTWTRKNVPAQLESLVKNPQRLEKLEIARQNVEGDARPEGDDISPFWRGRVPIFLSKENGRVRKVISMLNYAPVADIERLAKPKDMLEEMISPLIKEPFEQIANWDTFRDKPLVTYEGETKDYLGISMPVRLHKLAQVLVPIAELNRANPGGIFGMQTVDPETGRQTVTEAYGGLGTTRESGPIDVPGTARLIRYFLGVAQYDVNLEKDRFWKRQNFVRDLQKLKSLLMKAYKKGEMRRVRELKLLIDEVLHGDVRDPLMIGR